MRPNPLKALWAEGKPAFGTWCTLVNHPRFVKLLAACGLDFVILEMEHTDFTIRDVSTLALMAREAGIAPIVRPPGLLSPHDLTRALDAGAQGLLPDPAEQIARINAGSVTVAMIETQRGLDTLPEICAVDGLDAVMIGPDDLSQDLGVPGLLGDPKMVAATERVIEVCTERRVPWGFSCQDMAAAPLNVLNSTAASFAKGIQLMPPCCSTRSAGPPPG
jgi:2-keto-3-deoxy-L-rhamnonate aldolase RhmA